MIFAFRLISILLVLLAGPAFGFQHNGTGFVSDDVYIHNGTSFVQGTKYMHNGTVFEEIESGTPPEEFCPSCTGDLKLCWEITTNNTDITQSGGCGQDGITTIVLLSDAVLNVAPTGRTGYALYIPTTYDSGYFDISSVSWNLESVTTFEFDVYFTATMINRAIIKVVGLQAEDELGVRTDFTDATDLMMCSEGGNNGPVCAIADANLSLNTWYHVVAKQRQGATDPSLSITVNGVTATSNTDLDPWVNSESKITIPYDGTSSGGNFFYIKNIKIWNSWQ